MQKNSPYLEMVSKTFCFTLAVVTITFIYDNVRKAISIVILMIFSRLPRIYNMFIQIDSEILVFLRHFLAATVFIFCLYKLYTVLFIKLLEMQPVEYWEKLAEISSNQLGYKQDRNKEIAEIQADFEKLSYYMAHEQKNILSILRGKVELEEKKELLEEVDRVVVGLDNILTMSASHAMIKNQQVDMVLLCAGVVDDYRKVYPNITYDFDEESNYCVNGRELWLQRAVSNLVENAIKYGEDTPIHIQLSSEKGSIILSVEDNGGNLDASEIGRIFDMHYRTDGIKKDGYGIGLALVKHVCSLCSGVFWAEKTEQSGSRFYIILPSEGRSEEL